MMTANPQHDLLSLGKVCELLQQTPRQIELAAQRAGIVPDWRINSVPHFNAEQVEAIAQQFRKQGTHK